jgi:hypothetical protein
VIESEGSKMVEAIPTDERRSATCFGEVSSEAACPMMSMCRGITESRAGRYGPIALGVLFIAMGAAILLQPSFLIWLAGGTTILLGLSILAGGFAVRRFGAHLECCESG